MIKSIKKIIALTISTTSLLATTSISANAEWMQNSTGWWYTEGNSWATGWRQINNQWYYFDTTGYMKTGWLQDTDGKWYYLNNDGSMMTNSKINGYQLDSNGAWIETTTTTNTVPPQGTTSTNATTNTTQPTTSSQTSTSSTSSSNHSSSSSSSSSSSTDKASDCVSIFYSLTNGKIDSLCEGKQSMAFYSDDPNASQKYGMLLIRKADYNLKRSDLVKIIPNYEVKEENGVMKLVKKSETNTSPSSSNSSTTTPTVPTTTSSAVVITPVETPTTTGSSVVFS